MACSCYPLSIEGCPPNWNPECPEHGRDSAWYRSPEQVERRKTDAARLLDLQRRAREARGRSRTR